MFEKIVLEILKYLPADTPLEFVGAVLILAAVVLLAAGLGIWISQKHIKRGTITCFFAIGIGVLGIAFIKPETLELLPGFLRRLIISDRRIEYMKLREQLDDQFSQIIEAGLYTVRPETKHFFPDVDTINIDHPFSIHIGEVTFGDFLKYKEQLDTRTQRVFEERWHLRNGQIPFDYQQPVENVNWQEARNYTVWLREQTQWDLRLPTREQWIAACTRFAEDNPIMADDGMDFPSADIRSQVDHLLGNLREWSLDECRHHGHFLLGVNYRTQPTDLDVISHRYCSQDIDDWTGVGFRLVRIEH